MTRAWSGPAAAATLAEAPQTSTNQNTVSWPVIRRASRPGTMAAAQIMSFRKAWLPRPRAKNAYRQLSCSIRPGMVRPIATNASWAVPPSRTATASIAAPADQADRQGGARAAAHRSPPGPRLGAAEPDQQRVGRQPAGGVEHEGVGHVRQAERAEPHRRPACRPRRCSPRSWSGSRPPDPPGPTRTDDHPRVACSCPSIPPRLRNPPLPRSPRVLDPQRHPQDSASVTRHQFGQGGATLQPQDAPERRRDT